MISGSAAGSPASCPSRPMPSSASTSACWSARWRACRTSTRPGGVSSAGLPRRTSTCPTADSSARMRWLTADGVTPSRRAAASNVPVAAIASSARSWSG
ncbi:Uncharacterised protein [Mycobacteroides abscessus]|nr:Uncharacterised protein [Mycobacteroides abscessus]